MRTSFTILALLLVITSCANDTDNNASAAESSEESDVGRSEARAGIRLVSPGEADDIRLNPPEGLIVLDVRTPEEFGEGHIEGAIMMDFYEPDFAEKLADLDPEQPYLLYCRSGNRSGQTAALMDQLGFADVADVDGGVIAWSDAGLPLIR